MAIQKPEAILSRVPESCTDPWWSAQGWGLPLAQGWGLPLAEVLLPARRQGQGQVPVQKGALAIVRPARTCCLSVIADAALQAWRRTTGPACRALTSAPL